MNQQLAHLEINSGKKEFMHEHLTLVADRSKRYASAFAASEEGYLAGLLHDLGKYGELFQKRLRGEAKGVDHWSAGAWVALEKLKQKGIAIALAVQGHHIGLQSGKEKSLGDLNPKILQSKHPLNLSLSESDTQKLMSCSEKDNLPLTSIDSSLYQWGITAASMLDVRMLFSALVDADFIETEAWFNSNKPDERRYREPGLPLKPSEALSCLQSYLRSLAQTSNSAQSVKELRADLLKACLEAAEFPLGLFTLTAPTGSGKTLSMLAFALAHADKNNLRRIVLVIPYLSIIEQTAQVYRKVFESYLSQFCYLSPAELDKYILEHHSLSGTTAKDGKSRIEDEDYQHRMLIENWDAPIIITTSVQFLESLFSNRPSACRKLHWLAGSVILFDEVQTLPVSLAIPTLATLSRLAERYNSTIVFATATQPAFSHLDDFVKKHCSYGWRPKEIVSPELKLFERARRTRVTWPQSDERMSWTEIASEMVKNKQALCVVNLKKHAKALFDLMKQNSTGLFFHLSTNMCPAHRKAVLDTIRTLLIEEKPCYLISTQCIEAGVDIDFPVVYRALGPLDAIAQAAGRCNRNGHLPCGRVFVFKPKLEEKERLYPDAAYQQAASVTGIMLNEFNLEQTNISSTDIFQEYYRKLYSFARPEDFKKELKEAIEGRDFVEVARNYHIIDQDTINVLVSYDRDIFAQLREEALNQGLTRQWIMKARPYTVSLFRPKYNDDPLYQSLETIKLMFKTNEESDEWYIYRKEKEADYDKDTGLNPSLSPSSIIA